MSQPDPPSDSDPLAGVRALLVGVSGPAARQLTLALADAGADVALASATLDAEEMLEARRLSKLVSARGRRTFSQGWDVTLPTNIQVGLKQVIKEFGQPSLLVFNADLPLSRALTKTTDAEIGRVLQTNLAGAIYTARSFTRELPPDAPGTMVFVTGSPGPGALAAGATAYAAARAGVLGLVAALAAEFADRGIRAHALAVSRAGAGPGAVLVESIVAALLAVAPGMATVPSGSLIVVAADSVA